MAPKPFPRTITLSGGTMVTVNEVHYGLGRNYYRVSWHTTNGDRGCVAEWTARGFEEVTHEEFVARACAVTRRRHENPIGRRGEADGGRV